MAASGGSRPASWTAWRALGIPAFGYGIRYDHGLFRQRISDGWQQRGARRLARRAAIPWEFERCEVDLSDRVRRHGR